MRRRIPRKLWHWHQSHSNNSENSTTWVRITFLGNWTTHLRFELRYLRCQMLGKELAANVFAKEKFKSVCLHRKSSVVDSFEHHLSITYLIRSAGVRMNNPAPLAAITISTRAADFATSGIRLRCPTTHLNATHERSTIFTPKVRRLLDLACSVRHLDGQGEDKAERNKHCSMSFVGRVKAPIYLTRFLLCNILCR